MTSEQAPDAASWSVVVLTGGASLRMGSDKSTLVVEGRTLLERTLAGVPDAVAVVIAGPTVPIGREAVFVSEDPPGGGPVAGLDAAVPHVNTPVVVVLATDLPLVGEFPTTLAEKLLSTDESVDAVLGSDGEGRRQQLCAAYRVDALRRSIAAGRQASGASMRSVVDRLRVELLASPEAVRDVDTPEELDELRTHLDHQNGSGN